MLNPLRSEAEAFRFLVYVVLSRGEVPAERAHGHHREQRQADEHVRAVEAGEPVEDRALSVVLRREADVDVLVDLDEQERGAEQERGQHSGLQAEAVVRLHRLERPVHRERRGHEDGGVHARDRHGKVGVRRRPIGAAHDPDEEVGREEGPEDHDLADDEKQHPERPRVDPRRAVGLGRPVVLVVSVVDRRGFHQASAATAADSMCSTGLFVALCTRSTSLSATHFELSSGSVEITISEMKK